MITGMQDIEIDLADLSDQFERTTIRFDAVKADDPPILRSVEFQGNRLRIPLAAFFCEKVRTEIEHQLDAYKLYPCWEQIEKSIDTYGKPIRLVRVESLGPRASRTR